MKQFLAVIGVPGAGKTTLVEAALEGIPFEEQKKPVPHCAYSPGLLQLGLPREGHGGTDALSMSIAPKVVAALKEQPWECVLAEGDRLATYRFFDSVRNAGWELRVVWLQTSLGEAAARRKKRGSTQASGWLKGRVTKVYGLGRRYDARILNGDLPVAALVKQLREEPVIKALRGEA